jgi:hypothetical protein
MRVVSRSTVRLMLSAVAILILLPMVASPQASPADTVSRGRGFIVGQVIDKESGRPLDAVNVVLLGSMLRTQTDLDGRYRMPAPAGAYNVRAFRLGSAPMQMDSVRVTAGSTVTANFALSNAAVQLQSVAVTAAPSKATSEDALLALQKAAPRVSDGISAQAIQRAPGSSAGDAIVRVTGVSIVDSKFAVVRGLAERYSNTLLNGVELPSPEPLKKIVPLDIFPSSLLESIIVSKTATPDRPGDFAGGSVEVSTKEFPDERIAEANLSVGYGSQSTMRNIPHIGQRGLDYLGFDDGGRRQMPKRIPTIADGSLFTPESERFAESLRNVWTPAARPVPPNLGAGMNFGGRFGGETAPLGYALSATLSRSTDATPNRLSQLVFDADQGVPDQGYTSSEATSTTDLGAIANLSARMGGSHKFGFKNLYTRNAEERLSRTAGFETNSGNTERLIYQSRYITRVLTQTQLSGEHLVAPLLDSRFEWKATLALAGRDEPENRSLLYFKSPTDAAFALSPSSPSPLWFRFLDDKVQSAQLDWSVPVPVVREGALFKAGGLRRERDRTFSAYFFRAIPSADPAAAPVLALPPERVFSGEVIGSALEVRRQQAFTVPYESDDDVTAYYAMVDVPVLPWLRVIGGMRREEWQLNIFNGTKDQPLLEPNRKRTSDDLFSGNVTINVTDRQNIRLAAYQTVARPDPREVSLDYYSAITGDCAYQGNPDLNRSRILNGDVRWEFYPAAGELISVSAFYKDFTDPIGELLSYEGSSLCTTQYRNLESSTLLGGELEFRRALTFLPGPFARLALGVNLTLVQSEAIYRFDSTAFIKYKLQGQSDRLANLNLLYANPDGRFEASMLVNYFSDRIMRYGNAAVSDGEIDQVPAVSEEGRLSVDAKIRHRVGRATWSLSARNLTDNEVIYYQPHATGRTRTGYLRPGVSLSLGVGYGIR